MSPTLNVNPTLFVIPCKCFRGIIVLHCCNDCHLPNDFSSKFQSSIIIFHHKSVTKKVGFGQRMNSSISSMTILVHLFISVIQKSTIVTLNIIFSVVHSPILRIYTNFHAKWPGLDDNMRVTWGDEIEHFPTKSKPLILAWERKD